jgi:hypothetical protein
MSPARTETPVTHRPPAPTGDRGQRGRPAGMPLGSAAPAHSPRTEGEPGTEGIDTCAPREVASNAPGRKMNDMTDSASGRSRARLLMESFVRQALERLRVAALLGHPGEIGRAREDALRDHLRSFLPPTLGVSTGFVIDAQGGRSRQIDIIINLADYHAVFMVSGIPLVPVEAVIAVFEIKSSVHSRAVLHDCYDVLKSVKQLDRSNGGRNYGLIHTEPRGRRFKSCPRYHESPGHP